MWLQRLSKIYKVREKDGYIKIVTNEDRVTNRVWTKNYVQEIEFVILVESFKSRYGYEMEENKRAPIYTSEVSLTSILF